MGLFTNSRRIDALERRLKDVGEVLASIDRNDRDTLARIAGLHQAVETLTDQVGVLRAAPQPEAVLGAVTDLHVQATGIMDRLHALAARLAKARRPCDEEAEPEVEQAENGVAPQGTSRAAHLARKEALRNRIRGKVL